MSGVGVDSSVREVGPEKPMKSKLLDVLLSTNFAVKIGFVAVVIVGPRQGSCVCVCVKVCLRCQKIEIFGFRGLGKNLARQSIFFCVGSPFFYGQAANPMIL